MLVTEEFELGLFNKVGHANFCARCLSGLPATMAEADSSRMAVGFYCLNALDLLGLLDTKVKESDREAWRAWIWAQQVKRSPQPSFSFEELDFIFDPSGPGNDVALDAAGIDLEGSREREREVGGERRTRIGGFRPGPFVHVSFGEEVESTSGTDGQSTNGAHEAADPPHLIMTYTALLMLAILRDNFAQLDRESLVNLLRATQKSDGSFTSFPGQGESDIRMVYTAFAISAMLEDWSGVDVPRAISFTKRCMSYEGGFGQVPGNEAQGGSTYCALATLALAPDEYRKEASLSAQHRRRLERWLVQQQKPRRVFIRYESDEDESEDELELSLPANMKLGKDGEGDEEKKREEILEEEGGGFSGRTGKAEDACYSFWCGAALKILRSGLVGGGDCFSDSTNPSVAGRAGEARLRLQSGGKEGDGSDEDDDFVDRLTHARFLSRCQFRLGGLAKAPGAHPDPYHTYLALAALALYPPPQLPAPPASSSSSPPPRNQQPNHDSGMSTVEPSDTELLEEMKSERRRKGRESWVLARLDPLINASVETSRWAREKIPAPRG